MRVWALAATEDLHGNRVEYHYTKTPVAASQDTGAFYLSRIVYTVRADLTANRYVDFTYGPEVRPDVLRTYLAVMPSPRHTGWLRSRYRWPATCRCALTRWPTALAR